MQKRFKLKVLTSLLLTLSFFSASISGIMLYFSPRGRIANWADWTLFGLTKDGWTEVHTTAVALMLLTGLLHLFWFNWKIFLSYLARAAKGPLRYPRELTVSVVVFAVITAGTIGGVPGVDALIQARETILDSFEVEENVPPIAHAEELTLRQAAADIYDEPVDQLLVKLEKLGWSANADMTLREIADAHEISPQQLHEELLRKPAISGSGSGYGLMTLRAVAEGAGLDLDTLIKRAEDLGAGELTGDEIVKDIAENLDMKPYELLPKLDPSLEHE